MQLYIGNMSNLNYQLNGNFGEPVTYIGFPTESGKGSYISANQSFVLSAKSANLDGAWEFVRYYLTDEYGERQYLAEEAVYAGEDVAKIDFAFVFRFIRDRYLL